MRQNRSLSTLAFGLFAASVAGADVTGPNGRTIDCFCTDRSGGRVELGQSVCLQVDGRMFMAQCQMSLNVPMWRETSEGCLSSAAGPLISTPASARMSPIAQGL